jgi:hypothetical protein
MNSFVNLMMGTLVREGAPLEEVVLIFVCVDVNSTNEMKSRDN